VTIEKLISSLQALVEGGLPPGTFVYVPEKTRLNGACWRGAHTIKLGYDPHPISRPDPAPLVVYIS